MSTPQKTYWQDIPALQMPKNYLGEIIDHLDNRIAFTNNPDLRPAGIKVGYTIEMFEELIKCREDIIYFAENYYMTQTPNGFNFITLFDYQKIILNDMVENQKYCLLLGRQSGKTTLARIYILWCILFGKDVNYGIAANKQAQAIEILEGMKMAYMSLPLWMQQGVTRWNAMSIYLENKSKVKIAATSSSAFRGMSFAASNEYTRRDGSTFRISSGIYVDELAFVPNNKFEEFKNSVIPTVSSGKYGKIIYTSTPFGMNHFHKIWKEAEQGYNGFFPRYVPYWEHPLRKDPNWREEKIKELGSEIAFEQEFGCNFSSSSWTLINGRYLSNMTIHRNPDMVDHIKATKIYEHPKEGHFYTIGVDTAKYGEGDYLSMQVLDVTTKPFKQVASFREKDITYLNILEPMHELARYYNNAYLFIENNSGDGQSVADLLMNNYEYENIYAEKNDIFGFRTTQKTRRIGLQNLKQLVEDGMLELVDEETIVELTHFVLKNGKYQADSGSNDDAVMATLAAIFFLQVKSWVDIEDLHKFFNGEEKGDDEDNVFVFGFMTDADGNMSAF
jgi:hypothetical protein